MPSIPDIPPRTLLSIRICQFILGVLSLALSAASISVYKNIPRPATGDNILVITASVIGLLTTAYRIATYKARNPNGKHRFVPVTTESIVIIILLAAFIYGAVTTGGGRGACSRVTTVQPGDDDGDDGGEVVVVVTGSDSACALTKAATAFTAVNFVSFCASAYTVGKAIYDEKQMRKGTQNYSV